MNVDSIWSVFSGRTGKTSNAHILLFKPLAAEDIVREPWQVLCGGVKETMGYANVADDDRFKHCRKCETIAARLDFKVGIICPHCGSKRLDVWGIDQLPLDEFNDALVEAHAQEHNDGCPYIAEQRRRVAATKAAAPALAALAARIDAHLKADPRAFGGEPGHTRALKLGHEIGVVYHLFDTSAPLSGGGYKLTRDQAERFLAKLEAGERGRHTKLLPGS